MKVLISYFNTHLVTGDYYMNSQMERDVDKIILDRLKKGSCGFRELCADLREYISHVSLRKKLIELEKMGLVKWEKKRRGKKSVISLTETVERFEKKEKMLKAMWDDCFDKLRLLKESLKYNLISQKDAGSIMVWLIYETLPLLATGLIESELPWESRSRLSSFSADKFYSFFDEILKLSEKYPEIRLGFQDGLENLSAHVKPIEQEIETKFEQLAKLKERGKDT